MSTTTLSRAVHDAMTAAPTATSPVVVAGTLADVTTAARLLEPLAVPGTDDEREALLRLVLAHVALTSGGLWLVQKSTTTSATALLPPGSHPDAAALAWTAQLQLHLALPPGRHRIEAHLLLTPRGSSGAVDLVRTALAAAPAGDVVTPVPRNPAVEAVLRTHGFTSDRVPGLLRRTR